MPDPASVPAGPFDPEAYPEDRFVLDCRGRSLDCRPGSPAVDGAHVMGILNVTPDSFSDGGKYVEVEDAVDRAAEMLNEGAAIIDVGGESTRPAGSVYGEGAAQVKADEELDRVLPVVEAIARRFPEALISIDTYKPPVARAAVEAGAHIINDITGLRHFPETAEVAAETGAPIVVMHSVGEPGALTHARTYDDVTDDVEDGVRSSVAIAEEAGVEHIVTDPGFGFGKSHAENLRLLNTVDRLVDLGRPVLVGISRKSTIGAVLGGEGDPEPVGERLYGTLGATAVAVMRGATLVRTHDVAATTEMLAVLGATMRER
jgi:dihydropteroate synthase